MGKGRDVSILFLETLLIGLNFGFFFWLRVESINVRFSRWKRFVLLFYFCIFGNRKEKYLIVIMWVRGGSKV